MASQDKLDIRVTHYENGQSSTWVDSGATISRKKLIKIAFETLNDFPNISDDDRGHLLYAACTMKRVALSSWAVSKKCGCLVGTMLMDQGFKRSDIENDLWETLDHAGRDVSLEDLGEHFDLVLRKALIEKYGLDDLTYFASQSVKVKD
jgi:hypothetical protein